MPESLFFAARSSLAPQLPVEFTIHAWCKQPTIFVNAAAAVILQMGFVKRMYCVNLITGETTFRTCRPAAARVELVVMLERQPALRLCVKFHAGMWETETRLPAGWLFYAFEVRGRLDWDRDTGSLRTSNGLRCSLTLIASVKRENLH